MKRTRLLMSTAAVALLAMASCGSDDNAGSATTAAGAASATTAAGSTATTAAGSASTTAGSTEGTTAGSTEGTTGGSGAAPTEGSGGLTILFGSSGDAETNALKAAAADFTKTSGTEVTVTPAQDQTAQLAQAFASGKAPDVFYVGADQVANYTKAGNLFVYGDQLSNAKDFSPALVSAFTYDGKLVCAPKDASTLALFINTDDWTEAGLTDADIPTNWDQLKDVAKKLTTSDRVGLSMGPTRDRIDAFLAQNGGGLTADDGTTITADSEANVAALEYVKSLLDDGSLKYPGEIDSGWGGEAFGKNKAAMTIEGNWLLGAMKSDYPSVKYKVVELPAGPTGTQGTLVFTNCWGIAATSPNQAAAVKLVEYLTSPDVQLGFSKAFGVIPSIESAQADYLSTYPENAPFVDGVAYAKGVVNLPGVTDVLKDFDSQLESLATGDPKTILESVQQNLTDAISG
jgi:multiple sugar transport system substrate-binding protein